MKEDSLKVFKSLSWKITEPVNKVEYFDKGEIISVPNDIINEKVRLPSNKIVILTYCNVPLIIQTVRKNTTVKNVLDVIYEGYHEPIEPGDRGRGFTEYYFDKDKKYSKNEIIYEMIGRYFDTKARQKRVRLYEQCKLGAVDLLGDHIYFEGLYLKGALLYIGLGS